MWWWLAEVFQYATALDADLTRIDGRSTIDHQSCASMRRRNVSEDCIEHESQPGDRRWLAAAMEWLQALLAPPPPRLSLGICSILEPLFNA